MSGPGRIRTDIPRREVFTVYETAAFIQLGDGAITLPAQFPVLALLVHINKEFA